MEAKTPFLDNNFELVKNKLLYLTVNNTDYNVFVHGLNLYFYENGTFDLCFNNCGKAKETQYPVINVIINTRFGEALIQDSFDFLKTDDGYKLISIALQTDTLK